MIIISIILLLILHLSFNLEVCEPFPIHHNFDNCYPESLRRTLNPKICPNQGTWTCSNFECLYVSEIKDYECIAGFLRERECCTYKNVHYVDMWVSINETSSEFGINIHNIDIGIAGNDITIYGVEANDTLFLGVVPNLEDKQTFISVILRYEEDCAVEIEIYINATLVANMTHEDPFVIWNSPSKYMVNLLVSENLDDLVHFVSAHTLIPTPENIQYLYSLGPNRTVGVELCYNSSVCTNVTGTCDEFNITKMCNATEECEEYEECEECSTTCLEGAVSPIYRTLTIIFSVIIGILLFVIFLIFVWLFVRRMGASMPKMPTSQKMGNEMGTFVELKGEEEHVIF